MNKAHHRIVRGSTRARLETIK